MRAHTPGPWESHPLGGGKGGPNEYSVRVDRRPLGNEDGQFAIARVAARRGQPAKANARLIAAAPDLLWALRALIDHDKAAGPCDVPGQRCDCYVNALAAIAKAEGKS